MKNLILIDFNIKQVEAWADVLFNGPEPIIDPVITLQHGDIKDFLPRSGAEAFATAGNSYGIMDGGVDLAVRRLMPQVQERVLTAVHEFGGFVPVGSCLVVETGESWCPKLLYVPTMHVPELVRGHQAFLACHAALRHARWLGLERVAACGLATATGGFTHHQCAYQMRCAIEYMQLPPLPGQDNDGEHHGHRYDGARWREATRRHQMLEEVRVR